MTRRRPIRSKATVRQLSDRFDGLSEAFDPTKPIRTRDGRVAQIHKTVFGFHVGQVDGVSGYSWGADGFCNFGDRRDDLVNVDPTPSITRTEGT